MAKTPKTTKKPKTKPAKLAGSGLAGAAGKRLGPLPLWGWAAVVVVGFLIYRQTRKPPGAEPEQEATSPFLQGALPAPEQAPFGGVAPAPLPPTPTPAPASPARVPDWIYEKAARAGFGIRPVANRLPAKREIFDRIRRPPAPAPLPPKPRPGKTPPAPVASPSTRPGRWGGARRLTPTGRTPAKRAVGA